MTTSTPFIPAGTVTVNPDIVAGANAMPAVDGANTDTTLLCTWGTVWVSFGAGAQCGPDAPGAVRLSQGAPLLLTTNAATLAATTTNPNVLGGVPATQAAAATVFNCMAFQRGGTLTVTRGSTTARTVF